jgi:Leucine rich repeat
MRSEQSNQLAENDDLNKKVRQMISYLNCLTLKICSLFLLVIYTVTVYCEGPLQHLEADVYNVTVQHLIFNTAEEFERFSQNSAGKYPKLQNVTAKGCQLSSLSFKVNLPAVQNLDLSYNRIKSLNNTSFNKVPNVVALDVSHNDLTIIVNFTFRNLRNLAKLDLGHNALDTFDFKCFNTMLRTLNLQQNRIADIHPRVAKNISVREINLSGNRITNISALQLSCEQIEVLHLSNNTKLNFHGQKLKAFQKVLKSLFIDGVNHQVDMTRQLAKFENLSILGINQMDAIQAHETLNRLIISGSNIQSNGYKYLNHENFPALKLLKIPHYDNTADCKDLLKLANHLQSQRIKFEVNRQIITDNVDNVEQLECSSLLSHQWIWIAVAVLSVVFIIITVLLCLYCLKLNSRRNLVKNLARNEFQRYSSMSIQYPVEINPIYESANGNEVDEDVDEDEEGYCTIEDLNLKV